MKRILILNYEFPPLGGGASPVSYELAKRLSETGEYDIDVVTMHYRGLPRYEEVNAHMRIHRVRSWRSKKEICHPWEQATYLVSGYLKCRALLADRPADVVHCHFIIPTGVIAFLLKKKFGIPYIITAHGSDVPGFNTDRFKLLHKFTGPLLRSISRNARMTISPSNYLRGLILKNISNDLSAKIVVIPNGIDTKKFMPQPKTKTIFSSGRLLPRKGFQYLIQAVSDEDLGYEVHIAGGGPMIDELKKLAEKSKTKVVLHGWLDNNGREYKDLLERAAIYVLASERENASIALLEAMNAGCAIITTNVSGCLETVGDTGLVIPPRDASAINASIKEVMECAAEYGAKSRQRAFEFFDWNLILKRYISCL